MASALEDAAVAPPDSGHVFDWPDIQERPDSKLEVRYVLSEARFVAFLLDFNDFWFNGRYQYYKQDGTQLDRHELAVLCGQDEAEKLRREPGRKLKAFVPSQSSWMPLRSLREAQIKVLLDCNRCRMASRMHGCMRGPHTVTLPNRSSSSSNRSTCRGSQRP